MSETNGGNKILQNIISGLVVTVVTALIAYASHLSTLINEQKDEFDKQITNIQGQLNGLKAKTDGTESDVADLQSKGEAERDQIKSRIQKLEDTENCSCKIKK